MLSNENTLKLMSAKGIFKDNLRNQMRIRNVRSVEVCQALGVNKGTFSCWYTGRSLPSPTMLEQLCKYFDCTAEELLTSREETPTKQITSYTEQLEKIISYFKDGLITIDEYNLLKSKLMEELK